MQCPRCYSNNVTVNREFTGSTYKSNYMRTGIKHSWFFPSGIKEGSRSSHYRTIALCHNCGNSWYIASDADKTSSIFTWIIIIVLILGGFKYYYKDRKTEEKGDPTVINTDQKIDTDIWSKEYTSIEDFEWNLDEDGITLGRYKKNTKENKIRFSNRYTINGTDYHITKMDDCFFCEDIKSVIVSEGVVQIDNPTFNSCGLRYLYLPKSLEVFNGWSYLDLDLRELYYGGSEEEFYNKFDPKNYLDNVKIYFNVNPDDL